MDSQETLTREVMEALLWVGRTFQSAAFQGRQGTWSFQGKAWSPAQLQLEERGKEVSARTQGLGPGHPRLLGMSRS